MVLIMGAQVKMNCITEIKMYINLRVVLLLLLFIIIIIIFLKVISFVTSVRLEATTT